MASTDDMDVTTPNNDKYEHKKFEVKRVYAHKKFGTCISTSRSKTPLKTEVKSVTGEESATTSCPQNNRKSPTKPLNDIFRPYALPDDKPRKRKHDDELQGDKSGEELEMEFKRVKRSVAPSPSPSPQQPLSTFSTSFVSSFPMMVNPFHDFQQYHFRPEAFNTLLLNNQSDTKHMEEIIKRPRNFNLYDLMGQ